MKSNGPTATRTFWQRQGKEFFLPVLSSLGIRFCLRFSQVQNLVISDSLHSAIPSLVSLPSYRGLPARALSFTSTSTLHQEKWECIFKPSISLHETARYTFEHTCRFFARASGKASHTHHPSQLQTTYKSMFIWNRSISFLCYCELAFLSDLYTDANLTTALPLLLAHAASYRLCDKNNFCMLLRAAI